MIYGDIPTIFTPLAGTEGEVLAFARLIMGAVMIYFGWQKVHDLSGNAKDFVNMGFRPGWLWGTFIAFLEFFGGIIILLGVHVWVIATMFAVEMGLGAIMKIAVWKKPFKDYSYDLLLLAIAMLLLTYGPGTFTIF